MRRISDAGVEFIKHWEEFVGYPYDDKIPKQHIAGEFRYPQWNGGEVRGTITIGYGHTDAAGPPFITPTTRIDEPTACHLLREDLEAVEAEVNRAIKVEIPQHKFDMLVSLTYNCGSALPKVAPLVNAGDDRALTAKMMQFVCSKGERLPGLVNRRAGELALWHTPEDPAETHIATMSPKAEREPARDLRGSKSIAAGATVSSGGALVALQAMNDAAEPIKAARDNLHELGVVELVLASYHSPFFWVGLAILVAGAFVIWDRNRKRTQDHV